MMKNQRFVWMKRRVKRESFESSKLDDPKKKRMGTVLMEEKHRYWTSHKRSKLLHAGQG